MSVWAKGHAQLTHGRRLLSLSGPSSIKYLQNLLTIDVEKIAAKSSASLSTCLMLNNSGRIITDSLLWKMERSPDSTEHEFVLDVPSDTAEETLAHLETYKLRRTKINIKDITDVCAVHGIYGVGEEAVAEAEGMGGILAKGDPRCKSLGVRVLSRKEVSCGFYFLI